ncbi:heterokaryon incompatibility protein-domain-containing protein [Xylariaceae sp. FL0662B]|nr:heterokaryon incompatibility protein-domain-containing protein [Xylariaceae sp. FL0662B]
MHAISGDQIRILDLLPGDDNECIECEIHVATLSDNKALWIDQLCIKQSDSEEKSVQIPLMRTIYTQCTTALLWLGEIPEDVPSMGVEAVEDIWKYFSALNNAEDPNVLPFPEFTSFPERLGAFKVAYDSLHPSKCAWWTRIWVAQEGVLPSSADFLWGYVRLPWYTVNTRHGIMPEQAFFHLPIMTLIRNWDEAFYFRVEDTVKQAGWLINAKVHQTGPTQSFIAWRGRGATDLRDKVYGQLGLYLPGTLPRIQKCDYTLSVVDVFCLTTLDLIHHDGSLRALTLDPRLEPEMSTPEIPRWVLDLSAEPKYKTIWTVDSTLYDRYNANKGLQMTEPPRHTGRALNLSGFVVDRVSTADDSVFYTKPGNLRACADLVSVLRSWYQLFMDSRDHDSVYSEDVTLTKTFGNVVLGGLIRDVQVVSRPASERDTESVMSFIKSGEPNHTFTSLGLFVRHRRFFVTEAGRIGLGHLETRPGDDMWIFPTGKVPFILSKRKGSRDSDFEYDFIGAAFVQRIMKGELFEGGKRNLTEQTVSAY